MTEGVVWKQLLEFAIPMAIGLLFQQMYNTVDTIVVGRFVGKTALAAVGSTGSIIFILVGFCAGLATGASVVISQCYGAHDYEGLRDAVGTTMIVCFLMCVVATGLGVFMVTPMLRLMATPEDVLPQAREYLTIYFAGVSGLLLYNMGSGILRAVGDSRRPLYFLIFSAVINVIFDLLFVIRYGLGIAGVAYATILSQFLSAGLVLLSLSRTDAPYGIRWRRLRMTRAMFTRIMDIGLPSGAQQAITAFSNVFVQSYINAFGSACMAGYSSYNKLDIFIVIPMQSIGLASTTFVGQNYGRGQYDRAREGVRQSTLLALVITAALSILLMIFAKPLVMLFTGEADVIEYGVRFIHFTAPFYVTLCFFNIYGGALRGVGDAKGPMVLMLLSFVAFRQLYLYVTHLLGCGFWSVAIAYPVGWVMCSLLLALRYRRSILCRPAGALPVR
ncbi:MAG: MATE family efflux transporter [Oscillospiraceae bacterium]|nr:MATE family efflux transporter [Oscillospiraceae bacterium]